MLDGFSRFMSGEMGLNGIIIGVLLITLGFLIIFALKKFSKKSGDEGG